MIEFEITPNLVHDFSILGIAREAGALTDRPVTTPPRLRSRQRASPGRTTWSPSRRRTSAPATSAVVIEGITVGPSPAWLQRRLLAAGVRPINNVVDVTNYVMLEYGPAAARLRRRPPDGRPDRRPPRAAGRDDWKRSTIRCGSSTPRCSSSPTPTRRSVSPGSWAGSTARSTDDTTTILLESANFDMKSVRRTARELKLRTDASARFERGLDPNLVRRRRRPRHPPHPRALPRRRVTAVGGRLSRAGLIPRPLSLPFARDRAGARRPLRAEQVLDVLRRLGFSPALDGDGERDPAS